MQQYDPRLVGPDCYGDGGTPTDGQLYTRQRRRRHPLRAEHRRRRLPTCRSPATLHLLRRPLVLGLGTQPDRLDHEHRRTISAHLRAGKGISQSAATFQSTILVANNGKRYVNESTRFDAVLPRGRGAYSENPENAVHGRVPRRCRSRATSG